MSEYPDFIAPTTVKYCQRSSKRGHPGIGLAVPSTELCFRCHTELPQVLHRIAAIWPALRESVMRAPARVYDKAPSGGSGTADASSYWNPAATLVLRDVTDWVGFLGRTIARERRSDAPTSPLISTTGPTEQDAGHALAVIERWHSRWLSHHPSIGADTLVAALRYEWAIGKALNTVPVQRITLPGAFCQVVIRDTDYGPVLCEGQLVGVLRSEHEDEPSEVLCTNHPDHTVKAYQWLTLPPTTDQVWVTIDAAATALNTSPSNAYKIAGKENWRHTDTDPRGYLLADIRTTHERRTNA